MLQLGVVTLALGNFATGVKPWCGHVRQNAHRFRANFFGSTLWSNTWRFDVARQFFRAFGRIHIGDLGFVKIRHDFLDGFDGYVLLVFRE